MVEDERTKCSSATKIPLPMIATPTNILVVELVGFEGG
jgi:hypothetical protein